MTRARTVFLGSGAFGEVFEGNARNLGEGAGEIGLGAQILQDLGISSIRLRTTTPFKFVGLSGFGIEIAAVEPIE